MFKYGTSTGYLGNGWIRPSLWNITATTMHSPGCVLSLKEICRISSPYMTFLAPSLTRRGLQIHGRRGNAFTRYCKNQHPSMLNSTFKIVSEYQGTTI